MMFLTLKIPKLHNNPENLFRPLPLKNNCETGKYDSILPEDLLSYTFTKDIY